MESWTMQNSKVILWKPTNCPMKTVMDSINQANREWTTSLLLVFLSTQIIIEIKKISLSYHSLQYELIWLCTHIGSFMVNSAYHSSHSPPSALPNLWYNIMGIRYFFKNQTLLWCSLKCKSAWMTHFKSFTTL